MSTPPSEPKEVGAREGRRLAKNTLKLENELSKTKSEMGEKLDQAKLTEDRLRDEITELQSQLDEKSHETSDFTLEVPEVPELPEADVGGGVQEKISEKKNPDPHPTELYATMLENLTDQTITLDHFYGYGDVPVEEFLERVKEVSSLKKWNASQTFRRALLALRGPAATAVRNFREEINSLVQLSKFLNRRFGVRNPKDHFTRILTQIKQGNDSGRKFIDRFQDVKTKVSVALPGFFTDQHFVTFFKQALRPEYLREVRRHKLGSLEQCFDAAREADSYLGPLKLTSK